MDNSVLLSIIIPYYNSDGWIGKMLDSLMDQDLSNDKYEIIVIDDGSTQSICNLIQYTNQHPNIKYHRKKNGGVSDARNVGIDLAIGKWLYFCDSDDFVHPQILGSLIKTAEEFDLDMLVCEWCYAQDDSTILNQELPYKVSEVKNGEEYIASFADNPMSIGFGVWRYLIKKSVITSNNIRFENISFTEDRIFQLDLLLAVERIAHADLVLYYYVQHQFSLTHEPYRRNYSIYAAWLWHYIERLSTTIETHKASFSKDAIATVNGWRDMAVFSLLINSFRYCPVSVTEYYLKQLPSIDGAYPVMVKAPKRTVRFVRRLMGDNKIWLLLCRVFHILPSKIRMSL